MSPLKNKKIDLLKENIDTKVKPAIFYISLYHMTKHSV